MKFILGVGGKLSNALGKMANVTATRQGFVKAMAKKLRDWALDGLDVDFDSSLSDDYDNSFLPKLLKVIISFNSQACRERQTTIEL